MVSCMKGVRFMFPSTPRRKKQVNLKTEHTRTNVLKMFITKWKLYLLLSFLQVAIAASGKTLPTSRSKPSGPLYCACTTLTWWTDISPQSTTPQWFIPLTTPSSDTRREHSERLKEEHLKSKHPECLNFLGLEFRIKIFTTALCSA